MIENAFNPANRQVGEIEKYLETLLKAYEVELEAIRKRTKVNRLNFLSSKSFIIYRVYLQDVWKIIILNGISLLHLFNTLFFFVEIQKTKITPMEKITNCTFLSLFLFVITCLYNK